MAESGPPRIARSLLGGGGKLKIMRPKDFSGAGMHSGGGGGGKAGGGGGGGLAKSFGGGGESGDPAISGNFGRNPTIRAYGFPIAGGGLTDKGQADKEDFDTLRQGRLAYTSAIAQGATDKEAAQAAVKAGGVPLLMAMSGHPGNPLSSSASMHSFLSGEGYDAQQQNTYSPMTKGGQQVEYDPSGKAVGASDVPGFRAPGVGPGEGTGKTFSQTYTKSDGTQGTRQMQYIAGPNGLLQATPVEGSEGAPKVGKQPDMAQSDIAGLPPQVTADTPKTAFNRITFNTLATTPDVMGALKRMQDASAAMGLVKGPLATLSGQYFGVNGTGAQFKADRDLIQSQANKMTGSAYAANAKNFMEGIGSASDAPSFLKLQTGQMLNTLRNEGQSLADEETASHQGKLPPSLANQLIGSGIVPNGYQNQKTFDGMPPGEGALWKARFAPQALAPTDKAQLALDAAHGKFGPPGAQNTDTDFKNIISIRQQDKAQETAKQQQATASTAAQAAQPLTKPAQGAPGGVGQPAEGAEPGAQQPQQPAPQGQQPAQQGPGQPAQQQQPNGQQGQTEDQQQGAQASLPAGLAPGAINPLMPPTAVPGQPAQGVPATNATTPQPPPSPLPQQTSQMLTPQGGVPTPAVQAPVSDTAPQPEGSASAKLPPLNPDTIKTLQSGGVPTDEIENQTAQ